MDDFYDDKLSCLVLGYLRDEANFNGVEELIR
jgi:FAD synthase